jgi:outer membrane protein assembly factor BamA
MCKSGGWRYILVMVLAVSALGTIPQVTLSDSAFAQSSVIRDIRVAGNRRVEPETVRSYLRFSVGDAYDRRPGRSVDQGPVRYRPVRRRAHRS